MNAAKHPVFTIGHSTHSLGPLVALLRQHGVTVLADVRSAPYSRFNPQFNRETLKQKLLEHDIKYVFLGRELGARSDDRSCYENGRVQYARLAHTDLFSHGIERVIRGAGEYRVVLMCAEKEPLECHRTLLVARVLVEHGVVVKHILANGSLESHESTMESGNWIAETCNPRARPRIGLKLLEFPVSTLQHGFVQSEILRIPRNAGVVSI